ncbi:MAG: hypothetical protein E7039_10665 [Lentisphaerae bacterium]|nr:hypothetical protein [Lentisphaerota bacterium]
MKKIILLLFAAALTLPLAAVEHIWNFKDGSGSKICKDSGTDPVDLQMLQPDNIVWAREDDRGWFLNFNGGYLRAPNAKMAYADGLVIDIKFAANFKTDYKKPWMLLVGCAYSYYNGYTVMVGQDGSLLVCFPGTSKWYRHYKGVIKHLVDYELKIVQGNERVQVVLNGKILEDFVCKGKNKFSKDRYFLVGGNGGYNFRGNIYTLTVDKFTPEAFVDLKKQKNKKAVIEYPAEEIVPIAGITDPKGTVTVGDFSKFTPKPLIRGSHNRVDWVFRSTSGFFRQAPGSLHAPVRADGSSISYDPQLKGKYNIYIGVRAVTAPGSFSFAIGDTNNPYNVEIGAAGPKKHRNTEIMIEKNVDMTGKKIFFLAGGNMFVGYVKFIPSDNPRKKDYPAWKCVKITRGKKDNAAITQKKIENFFEQGYFKNRIYVDNAPLPPISAISGKRGFILEKRNWMDLAFESNKPVADSGSITLEAAAAPGEFEPVTFIVHALKDVGNITLTIDDKLAANDIKSDITVVRSIRKRTTNYKGASEVINGPQYLERTNTTELKKSVTKQFWITLKIGENVKPGKYKGTLLLTAASGKTSIPLTVTVYPFKLDDHDKMIGFFPDASGFFDNKKLVRSMAEHNINMFYVDSKLELMIKKDQTGKLYVDFSQADVIDYMRDNGMKALVVRSDELSNQSYAAANRDEVCRNLAKSITDEARKRNWGDVIFYGYDEALSVGKERLEASVWANTIFRDLGIKTYNTHIWYKTSRPYQKEVDRLAPLISIFVNRYNTRNLWYVDNWETMENGAKERGRELWSYNIDNAICFAQPAMWRFAMGWFFRTLGKNTGGQSVYAYNHFNHDPYEDLDGGGTDWMYDYPAAPGHKGGFSINYEAIREGIDDLRYIVTLENRIRAAKAQKRDTSAAEKVLNDIKKSFDFTEHHKRSVYLDSFFDKKWSENGKLYCSGKFNLLNGWSLSDYQTARAKIANAIIELDK